MAVKQNEISNTGIANISGLEVYMTVTINGEEFLVPIVATDKYGNAHKVLRRNLDNKIDA
jgi:hypothetical protein|tara:strand:- start:197 stop:376 length:180 start_codon:yes stop_codon:yes gene_type:complete